MVLGYVYCGEGGLVVNEDVDDLLLIIGTSEEHQVRHLVVPKETDDSLLVSVSEILV